MRVYVGFDDTDTHDSEYGTGKLVRRFERMLPEGCNLWGVVRQQLLFDERIPYTSHNSSACAIVDIVVGITFTARNQGHTLGVDGLLCFFSGKNS